MPLLAVRSECEENGPVKKVIPDISLGTPLVEQTQRDEAVADGAASRRRQEEELQAKGSRARVANYTPAGRPATIAVSRSTDKMAKGARTPTDGQFHSRAETSAGKTTGSASKAAPAVLVSGASEPDVAPATSTHGGGSRIRLSRIVAGSYLGLWSRNRSTRHARQSASRNRNLHSKRRLGIFARLLTAALTGCDRFPKSYCGTAIRFQLETEC